MVLQALDLLVLHLYIKLQKLTFLFCIPSHDKTNVM